MIENIKKIEEEMLILVDENDEEIGYTDKLSAHQKGTLHRAFSVFVFNPKGELLLQRRALGKYHSPGLWTNTCCSHPRKNEITSEACRRRTIEEMGIECSPQFAFSFLYKAEFENGLIEHEFDHVYFDFNDTIPTPNKDEVMDWRYISISDLQNEVLENPEHFTVWLKICLPKVAEHLNLIYIENDI